MLWYLFRICLKELLSFFTSHIKKNKIKNSAFKLKSVQNFACLLFIIVVQQLIVTCMTCVLHQLHKPAQ